MDVGRGSDGRYGDGVEVAEAAGRLRAELVEKLVAQGELGDSRWRAAFGEVPRHVFVPEFQRPSGGGAASTHLRLSGNEGDDADPRRRAEWLRCAYLDTALVTQWAPGGGAVSSSSQPSLMAAMLQALEVADGHRVLEIGTGTGYNAALLAHRLGGDAVVTVDLEEAITGPARERLADAGYGGVRVVTGDGAEGCAPSAPYDGLIATCAVRWVPSEWARQVRPGGLVVTPLGSGVLRLRVGQHGTGEGRFLRTAAYFVPLRGEAALRGAGGGRGGSTEDEPESPRRASGDRTALRLGEVEAFSFLLRFALADAELTVSYGPGEGEVSAMVAAADGSLAHVAPDGAVSRGGARDLWGEVERLYDRWVAWGCPERDRFGVTVTPDRQWVWLDHPEGGPWRRELTH